KLTFREPKPHEDFAPHERALVASFSHVCLVLPSIHGGARGSIGSDEAWVRTAAALRLLHERLGVRLGLALPTYQDQRTAERPVPWHMLFGEACAPLHVLHMPRLASQCELRIDDLARWLNYDDSVPDAALRASLAHVAELSANDTSSSGLVASFSEQRQYAAAAPPGGGSAATRSFSLRRCFPNARVLGGAQEL